MYLTKNNFCDFCLSTDSKSYSVSNGFYGWMICDKKECQNVLSIWKEKTTIPMKELYEFFGDSVNIMRSSGKKETNWIISSDAYLENKHGDCKK